MTAKFSTPAERLRQGGADLQRLAIFCTPSAPALSPGTVEVRVRPEAGGWQFEYCFALPGLCVPTPSAAPARRDELWRHTCAECFVRVGTSAYLEFNFSPSGDWAAYFFDDYRQGMRAHHWAEGRVPRVRFEAPYLQVWLPYAAVADAGASEGAGAGVGAGARAASLAAVTETAAGLQYWALHHPLAEQVPGRAPEPRPDFHHPGGFVWTLPSGVEA